MNNVMGLITTNYSSEQFSKLADIRPIATLPIGGRYRLVDFPLSNLVHSGIRTVGVTSAYRYRSLIDHLGAGKEWSLSRKDDGLYILPGSAYGMKRFQGKFLLRDLINNRPFLDRANEDYVIVSASNKIYNIDFHQAVEQHIESGSEITMLYKEIANANLKQGHFLDLDRDGTVLGIGDAATSGIAAWFMDCYIINRETLLNLMEWYSNIDYIDMMEIIADNIGRLKINSYSFNGYVGAVDSTYDYMQCSMDMLDPAIRNELFNSKKMIFTKVQDAPPAKYLEGAQVTNSIVASGAIVEGNVENSILSRNVKIGKGAVVKNCVILQRCVIEPGAVLENVICDKFAYVSEGVRLSGTKYSPLVIEKNQKL